MIAAMSLDQLEIRAAAAMDFAESIGRPLLAPERDTLRYLLVAAKCPSVKRSLSRLKKEERDSHARMIDRLRKLINPNPMEVLSHLEHATTSFFVHAEAIGRRLLPSEKRAWAWLLEEWRSRPVKSAIAAIEEEKQADVWKMIAHLRELIGPDPVCYLRLQRNRPALEAEHHEKNYALNTPPFFGVSIRRMNAREATERVRLLSSLGKDIGCIAGELALVRNEDRPAASRIVKLGKKLVKLSREFADRCKSKPDIPAERSLEEVMAEVKAMGALMVPVEDPG